MLTAVKEDTHDYRSTPPNYDGLWKNIIQELFQAFMAFFAPDLYPDIDFDKGVDFEGTELLPHILRQAKGKRYTDKLAKVTLKNGENQYVHIHIEVQAVGNKKFARRMFPYFYRIYENHTEPIYAIALLTDASEANYEDQFHDAFYGTEITYRYNTYHFYGKDEEALKQSPNPFALVVLAGIYASKKIKIKDEHKKSKEQKKQEREETKFDHKKILVDLAYEKYRHHPMYLSALLYFIDYIMKLPDELQEQFYESLPIIRNEKEGKNIMGMEKLRDTPTFGRLIREIEEAATKQGLERGMEQGIEQGIEQGMERGMLKAEQRVAKKLIEKNYSDAEISELTSLELQEVTKLRKSLEH